MRALSVRQPWAFAIERGGKDVENRSWSTTYRGLVAIHASTAWDDVDTEMLLHIAARASMTPEQAAAHDHRGAVVAVAEILGCHQSSACEPMLCSPWAAPGQWHWQLAHVRPLAEPVPCRGSLGLWRLPEDVAEAVHAHLTEPAA